MGTAAAVIGYARVSTMEQNLDLQLTAFQAVGAARIFADNGVNGSTTERPQLSKAMERLEAGDVLTVWKLDRLGRNTRHDRWT
jgi:DNA invertase Pin-like site-specific DNA recombinase